MIELRRLEDCCGCAACMNICPVDCISLDPDIEGFVYPITDTEVCIKCNACNSVCPVLKSKDGKTRTHFPRETKAYAGYIKDHEILLKSSSGGIFSTLAIDVIKSGGVVYGVAWEGNILKHIKVENLDGLRQLRGSKYAQSSIGNIFKDIRVLLQRKRRVLFSGTPCQVAGLKSYLRKEYENLILVEVACHGVPSPKALKCYLEELRNLYGCNVKIDFRAKPDGWRDYKVTAYENDRHFFYESQRENIFMKGFLRELYSRPICYECPFKAGVSGADITLADFWGIENVLPDFPSKNGASLILTHNHKGDSLFRSLDDVLAKEVSVSDAVKQNGALLYSEEPHPERRYFFRHIDTHTFTYMVNKCIALRPITQLKLKMKSYIKKFVTVVRNVNLLYGKR